MLFFNRSRHSVLRRFDCGDARVVEQPAGNRLHILHVRIRLLPGQADRDGTGGLKILLEPFPFVCHLCGSRQLLYEGRIRISFYGNTV